jgi:HTH-type transcriptional regulator, competence development regulator
MNNSFGIALKDKRRAAGLTQRELAERSSLDFSYISKLENGRLPPPAADTVVTLCKVLGISPEQLLALTRKIPSAVQENVSSSASAQHFLLEAERMSLTDSEWGDLTQSLHRLRGDDP